MSKNFRLNVEKAIAESDTKILSGSSITFASASFITGESGSVINLYSPILIPVASASAMPTPYEGTGSLYVKGTDNKLYFKNDGGDEYDLTIGSTPGGELTASNLMIDGSTSGSINFVNDGVIYIKDNDATALQVQEATNAYMTFDTSNGSEKVIISKDIQILSTDAGAAAAPTVDFFRNSSSPDDSDIMGKITFTGKDDGGNTHEYAAIQSEINDVTGAGEDGVLIFNILKNASTKSVLELKNNEAVFNNGGADIDFRIETDDETHFMYIDGNANRMSIGDSTDAPAATFEVTNHATAGATGAPLVQLNSNDTDQIAVDINAVNIDADVIDITADTVTTAFVMDVTADAITTGGILNLVSDSANAGSRELVTIHNDNASATSAIPLFVQQDANAALSGTPVVGGTTVAYFRQTNANTAFGPIIVLDRRSSTVADDMGVGLINFQAQNDNDESIGFARISAEASDVSDGSARGKLIFRAQLGHNANEPEAVEEMMHIAGGDVAAGVADAVVINDQNYDIDFRVASSGSTHALFVDGGSNFVRMDAAQGLHLKDLGGHANTPASNYGVIYVNGDVPYFKTDGGTATSMIAGGSGASAPLTLTNASDSGSPALTIANNDVDEQALDINAANTTAEVVSIVASSLTTGKALDVYSNSSNGGERDLVRIKNDSAAADATTLLRIHNDADPDDTPEGATMVIEHNFNTNNRNNLALTSTGVTGTTCAALSLQKTTTSEADDGFLGIIRFQGKNSNHDLHEYASIVGITSDVTDGDEGGLIKLFVHAGGTAGTADFKELLNIGGEDVANGTVPAVVVNEDGINCDFRVESDAEDEAIFLDASAEELHINKGESAFTTQIHNTNDVAITVDATGVVFNEDGHATNDFRVESDDETHMLFVDSGNNRVSIGDSTDAPAATLEITNHATAGAFGSPLVQLNSNDTDQIAIDINAANIDADVIDITADAVTTAYVLDVTADALTTGGILNLVSDSADTSDRALVTVHNDNTAATGTIVMHLKNDAIGGTDDPVLLIESTANEGGDLLVLKQGGNATATGPTLRFERSSGTTGTEMEVGEIMFEAENDSGGDVNWAKIRVQANHDDAGGSSAITFNTKIGREDTSGLTDYEVIMLGHRGASASTSFGADFVYNPLGGNMLSINNNSQFILSSSTDGPNLTYKPSGSTLAFGGGLGTAKGGMRQTYGFTSIDDGWTNAYGYGFVADGDSIGTEAFIPDTFGTSRATTVDTFIVLNSGSQDADEATACVPDLANRMILYAHSNAMGKGLIMRGLVRCSTSMLRTSGSATNFQEQFVGQPVYLGTTSGTLDLAQPSTTASGLAIVRICGHVLQYINNSSVIVDFRPSHDFFQI